MVRPLWLELVGRLTRSPPYTVTNRSKSKGLPLKQHVIDSPSQLGCQNAQFLSLPVLLFNASEEFLTDGIAPQKQHGGFGEGPLEVDIAHLATGRLRRLSCRFVDSLTQAAVGDEILDPREALDVVDLVEQGQRENLADALGIERKR